MLSTLDFYIFFHVALYCCVKHSNKEYEDGIFETYNEK